MMRERTKRRIKLTPLQLLILQSARPMRDGLIRVNRHTPLRIYRMLAAVHGCLEEVSLDLYRVTDRGFVTAERGYYDE
jgi:hypothetical protein